MTRTKIGVIGCGTISDIYLTNLTTRYTAVEVVAVADMFIEKAEATAQKYGIAKFYSTHDLLADPEVEIVLNLTIPAAHTEINLAALEAGKHVYCEKPLALNMADADKTLALAKAKGLFVGCAPDTFMGAGLQTCRKLIDEGWIGEPVSATANMICHGHESWHPAPEFYYKKGAGPMMDMGPYYITALVNLLGPIEKLNCFAGRTFDRRKITSKAQKGKIVDVEVLTNYFGLLKFSSGVIANITMSFDIWLSNLPCIEIYGTKGTLIVSDPNMFAGTVKVLRGENMLDSVDGMDVGDAVRKIHSPEMHDLFKVIPLPYEGAQNNLRGLGLLDMALAIQENRPFRANSELAYHVTEALVNFDTCASSGDPYVMTSTCEMPEPMVVGTSLY